MGAFFILPGVVTPIFNKPLYIYVHTNLSIWECLYTHFKILQILVHEIFSKEPIFFNILLKCHYNTI